MLNIILIAIAVVVVLFVLIVALRPSQFRVSRSARMSAPPDWIFPHVNELHKWEAWNPWGKLDPDTKLVYDGPPAGVGATYSWAGNNQVGEGRNTIVNSKPNERVLLRLDFAKPMKATNMAEFTFVPDGSQTVVTWTMTGKNNFVGKAFGLFINCDKMCGGQFEKGLAAMKSLVETNIAAEKS
jgi:hypothetical protein